MLKHHELLVLLQKHLEMSLAQAEQSRREAQEESNRHIGRMESRYDTFKEEAQYLADNYNHEANKLREALKIVEKHVATTDRDGGDSLDVGSVFGLESGRGLKLYFLFEVGGGIRLHMKDQEYYVITPETPLGRSVRGRRFGESIIFSAGGKDTNYRIVPA